MLVFWAGCACVPGGARGAVAGGTARLPGQPGRHSQPARGTGGGPPWRDSGPRRPAAGGEHPGHSPCRANPGEATRSTRSSGRAWATSPGIKHSRAFASRVNSHKGKEFIYLARGLAEQAQTVLAKQVPGIHPLHQATAATTRPAK